ncbi:hypothetical protein AK88_02998 [Plasmodium fragile]|uniref:Pv-fam-b protein n=1 Tax=Plasmodium fragile TaxID=5857 RepID=A0A0D9QK32_PLAFR|nr:uncharacterized protein AK88_02998 [Plasmodium fragile]KJP87318.1 hypothetical protein AK88_02998 [Plasmodium fragile]
MMETKSKRDSNGSAAASYYEGYKCFDERGADFCKSAKVDASKRVYKCDKFSIPLFFLKAFFFVSFIMLLQFHSPSMSAHETQVHTHGTPGSTASRSWYPREQGGNRILAECLKNINTTYDKVQQNTLDKIENVFERLTRTIASKIMAFIKKIDLMLEKEIVTTLKYIDNEKDEPIKSGLNFFKKLKKFFSFCKIFSTPVLGAFVALAAYHLKAQAFTAVVSLGVAFLPLVSTLYLMYKVLKVRGDMST